jgi:signal transduction histidine kinase
MTSRHGLRVTLDTGAEPAVPLEVKEALFRIAQEALHNVARHARAGDVTLALAVEHEMLVLRVADDGVGFDAGAEFAGHLGQKTMRERAELVGGTLEVRSVRGSGTVVLARVPTGR